MLLPAKQSDEAAIRYEKIIESKKTVYPEYIIAFDKKETLRNIKWPRLMIWYVKR